MSGVLPGYPASHGCIRMPMAFAMKMWNWTKMGARVVVTPGEITPESFAHPLLATMKVVPQPMAADEPKSDAPLAAKTDKVADAKTKPAITEPVVELRSTIGHASSGGGGGGGGRPRPRRGETDPHRRRQQHCAGIEYPGHDVGRGRQRQAPRGFHSRRQGRRYVEERYEGRSEVGSYRKHLNRTLRSPTKSPDRTTNRSKPNRPKSNRLKRRRRNQNQ